MDETDVALELVDLVAKSLGYEYAILVPHGRDSRRCACVFRCGGCSDILKMKTADGQLEIAELDMPSSNGKIPVPLHYGFAKELYRILDNGKALYVAGQKLEASMVPKFMIECVLNGIC